MLHGTSHGVFLDDKRFWPIYERAQKLDVPIYLHPSIPLQTVMDAYYNDYTKEFPMVIRAAWGFTVETATLAIRMVLSGVFDKYPDLKIVLGHLGETLPFLIWRIDQSLSRPGASRKLSFRDVFSKHFYLTTSGNFSNPALLCCVQEMGVDRILFAIDWPFVANPLGTEWIDTIPLCEEDKIKILCGNAQRLLRMWRERWPGFTGRRTCRSRHRSCWRRKAEAGDGAEPRPAASLRPGAAAAWLLSRPLRLWPWRAAGARRTASVSAAG